MKVSILMPVRNAMPYLSDCLTSIAEQTFNNWELIAVNDHSSDSSEAILKEFALRDSRVKLLNNRGKGIIEALRSAYLESDGELIHRMDADDIMPNRKLETLVGLWQKGSVVTGKVKYFSDDWLVGLGFQNYESWINGLMDKSDLWADLYMECPIPSPAWLIHRDDMNRIGGFDCDLLPEDYDLCFRMYASGLNVVCSKEIVHYWRDSQNRTSRKNEIYFPMSYYPLKVHYFLELEAKDAPLILWGAGKKGKLIARLLLDQKRNFTWMTDNPKKVGVEIAGKVVEAVDNQRLIGSKTILAVASPDDKTDIQARLDAWELTKAEDYWWFC